MKQISLLFAVLFLSGLINDLKSCTTFVVSGRYTHDGRPILYKHRDSGTLDNALVLFTDGKYDYIGLVNSNESWSKEVWGGFNSAGFAIMNSAAYNNNIGDTTKLADQEGVVMKLALQQCATLEDFEKLLSSLPKPLGVDANFGVIDAGGGAAYYETGNYGFKKIDANDPVVAPFGYLVRTNYSFTGVIDKGFGYIRYATANEALYSAVANKSVIPENLFNLISRNLNHSLTGENMRDDLPGKNDNPSYRFFEDYIPRNSSASAIMVTGVRNGEDACRTMMWNLTGFPLTTVAVPVWITGRKELPLVVSMKENLHSPLCDAGMELKKQAFPVERGSGYRYINLTPLLNKEGEGIMQLLGEMEKEIFRKTEEMLDSFPDNKLPADRINDHYTWIDNYIIKSYKEIFGITVE